MTEAYPRGESSAGVSPFEVVPGVFIGCADPASWTRAGVRPGLVVSLRRSMQPLFSPGPGLRILHHPLPYWDIAAPHQTLRVVVDLACEAARNGVVAAVHCYAGIDRSGLFAQALLVRQLGSLDDAVAVYARRRPVPAPSDPAPAVLREFFAGESWTAETRAACRPTDR
jgi:hypothetical protein